ncbi:MAG: two-component system response regulator CreB [bacterium]|nr:two-component system response regulator CreB [bacterium]
MKTEILLIEDESGIADTVLYALKTEGFEPRWCATGAEGLAAAKKGTFSLAILDVGLPDINGFELFKDIRGVTDMPIIFLTARSEEIDRIVGLEMGADDYIAKPFSPRELTARVKAVLRRMTRTQNAPEIPEGLPFRVDDKKKTITYQNQQLSISRYEFGLLKTLIEHPGWVFSRQQLMERSWDEPDAADIRTIDSHIRNLRQKLKQITPDCDPIVTHRGSGYALKEDW